MASIYKRGKKFSVCWRTLAGQQRWRTCPTKRDADRLKLAVESARSLGRDWEPAFTGAEPLVEEVAKAYIARRALKVRPHTLRMDGTYLDVFQRFVATRSKRPTVSLFSRPLLDEYMEWLARPETSLQGKKAREPSTIAKFVRAAQQLWIWAEYSKRWPEMIPRPEPIKEDDLPRSRPQPPVAPTWEEMDACVNASVGTLRKLAVWLRYTGLRVTESMLFLWSDIDLKHGMLTIRPEVDKKGLGRTIPLSPLILDEIKTWAKRDVGEEREGYVIPSSRKPGPREREARGRDMARAWKRAGVREAVYRRRPDHAFRIGFKSGLLNLRAHPDAIDFLQGHKLGEGSRGRYIDAAMLHLPETVGLIPPIAAAKKNVAVLPKKRAGRR